MGNVSVLHAELIQRPSSFLASPRAPERVGEGRFGKRIARTHTRGSLERGNCFVMTLLLYPVVSILGRIPTGRFARAGLTLLSPMNCCRYFKSASDPIATATLTAALPHGKYR